MSTHTHSRVQKSETIVNTFACNEKVIDYKKMQWSHTFRCKIKTKIIEHWVQIYLYNYTIYFFFFA